jgi:hypothetical protein
MVFLWQWVLVIPKKVQRAQFKLQIGAEGKVNGKSTAKGITKSGEY